MRRCGRGHCTGVREEGFPVCGDPGVANTTATGCACFPRSSVNFHVLATLPPCWRLMGQDADFNSGFPQMVANAALTEDNWTSILSLDSVFFLVDIPLQQAMVRLGQIKGNRTYWLGGYRDEALPVDAFLAQVSADGSSWAHTSPTWPPVLHQQTLGERLLSLDVSTERVVTRDNFARGQQQRLADCRIARMLGQEVETMFPVCDVHAGCGGNDTAPPAQDMDIASFRPLE
eukprot:jgi/Mesvir1/25085/Mv07813-RA.1